MSLCCGQNKAFEDVTLRFGKQWSTFFTIFLHFMDQTTGRCVQDTAGQILCEEKDVSPGEFTLHQGCCLNYSHLRLSRKPFSLPGCCGVFATIICSPTCHPYPLFSSLLFLFLPRSSLDADTQRLSTSAVLWRNSSVIAWLMQCASACHRLPNAVLFPVLSLDCWPVLMVMLCFLPLSCRPSTPLHPAEQWRSWPLERQCHRRCILCESTSANTHTHTHMGIQHIGCPDLPH